MQYFKKILVKQKIIIMKNKIWPTFLNIFLISIGVTILGFWLDSDPPAGLSTTLFEFVMMTIILFFVVSVIYFGTTLTLKKVKQLLS